MSAPYIVEPIGPRTMDRAYPLAKASGCTLTLSEWQAFCRSLRPAPFCDQAAGDSERALVARNFEGYVKGLCFYSITDDSPYGRLLDVPIFVVASAADAEGVATELARALASKCDRSVSSGIRFWPVSPNSWTRRQTPEAVRRADLRLFLRPLPGAAEIGKTLG
jgi:hypothetical protein